jgi:branched-subunit amino acid aminotransferase/4-amino-4-deoxychorismate lyase
MDELAAADGAFLASTTREVQPVSAIDKISFDGVSDVVTRIAAAVSARIRSELDA